MPKTTQLIRGSQDPNLGSSDPTLYTQPPHYATTCPAFLMTSFLIYEKRETIIPFGPIVSKKLEKVSKSAQHTEGT